VGGTSTTPGSTGLANPNTTALAVSSAATNGLLIQLNQVGPPNSLALSGTPQITNIGTGFALALQVTVRDVDNLPIPDEAVTFNVPATGPFAALSAGPVVTTVGGRRERNARWEGRAAATSTVCTDGRAPL
jgi:hypothetical protein